MSRNRKQLPAPQSSSAWPKVLLAALFLLLTGAVVTGWTLKWGPFAKPQVAAKPEVTPIVGTPGDDSVKSCCRLPSRFATTAPSTQPAGMVWVPAGQYTMGSDAPDAEPQERPAHQVKVDGFWMDETTVTNAQFRKFVEATHYVTTAERKPDWEELKKQVPPGTPKPPDSELVAASVVFKETTGPVRLDDVSQWWAWVPGANWRQPEGPGSSIEGKDDHPVVQVTWEDAMAYCKWAGKRLPTEAEWEYAARGGLEGKKFFWGDDPLSEEHPQCNTWTGRFPFDNTKKDGFARSSPVKTFKPNGYGLYDMAGNVWQWCSDKYHYKAFQLLEAKIGKTVAVNPPGPDTCFDPTEALNTADKRVTRGGSFLCNASYCASYRITARRGTDPQTSLNHTGFRCVATPDMLEKQKADPQ